MIRRLIIAGIIVYISDPYLQVSIFTCLQILHVCYLVVCRPIEERQLDIQEIQNEILTLFCVYTMTGMTENGSRLKTPLGLIFVSLFMVYICANGIQMLWLSASMALKSLKIWLAKRKR